MTILLLAVRLILAAVFFVAAASKLADRKGSQEAIRSFGLAEGSSRALAVGLPVVELIVAGALLAQTTARWGAVAALGLLFAFMLAIAINLARGRTPDCHCFGRLHSAPAGTATLLRNGVLIVGALLVVAAGRHSAGPSAVAWLGDLSAAGWAVVIGAALGVATALFVVLLLLALLRQNGRLVLRVEALEAQVGHDAADGLPIGAFAPGFELRTLGGFTLTLADLLAEQRPVLLVFTEPHCGPCAALVPELGQWQDAYGDRLTIAVVTHRDRGANRDLTGHGLRYVLLQRAREVSVAYGVAGTPTAVLIAADGTVASSPAAGPEPIRGLVSDAVAPSTASRNGRGNDTVGPSLPWGAKSGDPAPDFLLPEVTGASFALSDLRGQTTMLLFWDPGCGFCRAMLEDLRAWERERSPSAPIPLVISAGGPDANRALGLTSLILLDEEGRLRRPYGIPGTPSAVLVDAQNRIASEVALGADAVLALAGSRAPVHA